MSGDSRYELPGIWLTLRPEVLPPGPANVDDRLLDPMDTECFTSLISKHKCVRAGIG